MKCPIDQTEMEKGILQASGELWSKSENKASNMLSNNGIKVYAWHCPKCGKVELSTGVDEKEVK